MFVDVIVEGVGVVFFVGDVFDFVKVFEVVLVEGIG